MSARRPKARLRRRGIGKPKAGPPAPLRYGFYEKREAQRLLGTLRGAGIPAELHFDREMSRMHAAATNLNPRLRRRSSFRDVKTGYFVQIPAVDAERAAEANEGGSITLTVLGAASAEARIRCAACGGLLDKDVKICPSCNQADGDEAPTSPADAERGLPPWALWVTLLIGVAVAAARLLR